jgi:predicted dehydrogenase
MTELRYDLIGCGEVLTQSHAPILRYLVRRGYARIGGVFDVSVQRAEEVATRLRAETFGVQPTSQSVDQADVALIATPPDSHAALAEQYVRRGKQVLLEKPFVATPTDATRLQEACAASGGRIVVGHMRRLFPGVRASRDFIAAGGLGRIRRVEASEGARWEWPAASNYVVANQFGGVIYDTGSHLLDTMLFILGLDDSETLSFTIDRVKRDRRTEPSHDVRAEFSLNSQHHGELAVSLALSRVEPLARVIKVIGTTGTLVVSGSFTSYATMIARGKPFRVMPVGAQLLPRDYLGCFLLEHLALHPDGPGPAHRDLLDSRNFVALTSLLHALWCHRATPESLNVAFADAHHG